MMDLISVLITPWALFALLWPVSEQSTAGRCRAIFGTRSKPMSQARARRSPVRRSDTLTRRVIPTLTQWIDAGSSRHARLRLDALGDGGEQFIDDKWLVDDAKRPVAQQLIDLIWG